MRRLCTRRTPPESATSEPTGEGPFNVTSGLHERPIGSGSQDWRRRAPAQRRPVVAVGIGLLVSLVLVGLAVVAGAFVVHTVSAALSNGSQGQFRSGSPASGLQSVELQSRLVDGWRSSVVAYAEKLTEFKAVTARPPGAPGINLDAAEVRRRGDVLSGLVLDCINAVDRYNLAAQAVPVTELRSAGLPERYVWAVDCASGQ